MTKVRIAPSILSSDFGRLAEQVQEAEAAGADWIHVDVMDGHFVPNITIGPVVTEAVKRATTLPVDVHLMIDHPERYVEAFRDAGADGITVHAEACRHLHRVVAGIRETGAAPGVAVNPATPVAGLTDILPDLDLALIMSVNPGFGGQAFIDGTPRKVRELRELEAQTGARVHVQVDGGISADTARRVSEAGADVLVAGSAVFRHPRGVRAGIDAIRAALDTGGDPT